MTEKEKFLLYWYDRVKLAISAIDEDKKSDIYALSFWYYNQKTINVIL